MPNQNPKKAFGDKKPPLGQLPLVARIHGALAFFDGSGKYGYRNWRENPVELQTYIEAIHRHTELFANGEDYARDTLVHNLGGVIASAGLMLDAMANGCAIDNRVKSQAACDLLHAAEADIARLNAQHAARKGDVVAIDARRQLVEARKRRAAAEALALVMDLERLGTDLERLHGAKDVLLNMVNGVYPNDPEDDALWADVYLDNDDTEGGEGV